VRLAGKQHCIDASKQFRKSTGNGGEKGVFAGRRNVSKEKIKKKKNKKKKKKSRVTTLKEMG